MVSPDVAKTIELLNEFRLAAKRWFDGEYAPEGEEALRTKINRSAKAAQNAVSRVGCLKLVSAAPPPTVGGMILKNVNPFNMIFESYYGMSVIPLLIDSIDQAIGVYEDPSYQPESPRTEEQQSPLSIFVSHSSADAYLAGQLTQLLRGALPIPSAGIRCTSVDGYRLPGGADSDEQIRREILDAPFFIGLISETSIQSAYVLFELGARWGSRKQLLPLLAPKASPQLLRGPLSGLNALQCDSRAQLHQLIRECAATLGIEQEPPEAYESLVSNILTTASSTPATDSPAGGSAPPDPFAGAEQTIVSHCEAEWPDDYRMRMHCEEQQRQALEQLRAQVSGDIPSDVFQQIREKATREWPTDFRMRLFAERQQLNAFRALKRSRH